MRIDFISQRDPGDENDYWYAKFGYSFWPWMLTEGLVLTKGEAMVAIKKERWIEKEYNGCDPGGIATGYLDKDVVT